MHNPFAEPNSPETERDRIHRKRFKTGVYAYQAAMLLFLLGLLVHGYFAPRPSAEFAGGVVTTLLESAANPPAGTVAQLDSSF